MTTKPVVSVVMLFHRLNPFMAEAVGSVLNQTFRDLELILVDNGTGLGAEALGEGALDPRVRFVRLPRNEGIPTGHNAGIAAALGEFVTLLDYDDVALPTRVERQVAALRADPRLGLVSCRAERINEHGTVIGQEFSLLGEDAQRDYTRYAAPVVTPAYTGRREVFAALPYRAEFPLAADFDFLARVAERWTMQAVPEVLLRYRWHAAQTTQQKAAEIERSLCAIRLLTARRRAARAEDLPSLLAWQAGETLSMQRPLTSGFWVGRDRWARRNERGGPSGPALPRAADLSLGLVSRSESCRQCAELCLAEKFPALAAYHARRVFVLESTAANFTRAGRLALRALVQARGSERRLAARLFLMGPVRAHRLRPA